MENENLFLISSNGLDHFSDNKRNSFKNSLINIISQKKENELCISVESVIFEKNFASYESKMDDVVYIPTGKVIHTWRTKFKIFNLAELILELQRFFYGIENVNINDFSITKTNNKLEIRVSKGLLLFSTNFFNFLKFENHLGENEYNDLDYFILHDFKSTPQKFSSVENVALNSEPMPYINLECDAIQPYSHPRTSKNIIMIPLKDKFRIVFHESERENSFYLNSTYLRNLGVNFLQPSGQKVYFEDGSPTIVKMKVSNALKKDFFYMTVSSQQNTYFPENNFSDFSIELPAEKKLDGRWGVTLVNSFLPPPKNFLQLETEIFKDISKRNYICLYVKGEIHVRQFPLKEYSKQVLAFFIAVEFKDLINVYVTEKENFRFSIKHTPQNDEVTALFASSFNTRIINKENLYLATPPTGAIDWVAKMKTVQQLLTEMKFTSDNLSSIIIPSSPVEDQFKSSCVFAFPLDVFYNQEVVFKEEIGASRQKLASLETFIAREEDRLLSYLNNLYHNDNLLFFPPYFFLYSDFVKESAMGDKAVNILRILPYKNNVGRPPGGIYTPSKDEFYTVNKSILKTLSFRIRTHSGGKYSFISENAHVMLTLKFEKMDF